MKRVAEIVPDTLYQSGHPAALASLDRRGVDAIVAVGASTHSWVRDWTRAFPPGFSRARPSRRIFVHAPMIDASGYFHASTAHALALYTEALCRLGRTVLVHCDAGIFRSRYVCALVYALLNDVHGPAALEAVGRRMGIESPSRRLDLPDWDEFLETWPP